MTENDMGLWLVNSETFTAHKVAYVRLNDILSAPYHWLSECKHLLCFTVPQNRGPKPAAPPTATGPIIRENK